MTRNLLRGICVTMFAAILLAGLWPFDPFPRNDVHWIGSENGLFFGTTNGVVVSIGSLSPPSRPDAPYRTIEIWVEPKSDDDQKESTFFSFCTAENRARFSLAQYTDTLIVRHENQSSAAKIWIDDALRRHKQTFITLTSGSEGLTVYIDGRLAKKAPNFGLSANDFSGEIVMGVSPANRSTWAGWLRGLAVYDRELSSEQVFYHYERWTGAKSIDTRELKPAAFYRFDERAGSIARNRGAAGPDLAIPASFKVPHSRFVEMRRMGFGLKAFDIPDIAVNVIGFIPFGFFFCAYLSSVRPNARATLATIVLGGLISLSIEVLQNYIPARDSDMMDVIANTLGTILGAMLYK